jgi:DUF4097 and DUF4098 domain-containing protein YvlB
MFRLMVLALLTVGPALQAVRAADEDISRVLGSVEIAAGSHSGDATTVNGSIELGARSVVKRAQTVNGSITVREQAAAQSLETVNGKVDLERGARVTGNVHLVNGSIALDQGADVGGRVSNVNGSIKLQGAHIGGGIETTAGDIEIGAGSHVEGGILVNKENGGWFHSGSWTTPRVVIGPEAVVQGSLVFDRDVKLYVSDRARIGSVKGATAVRFSGNSPPP